MSSLNCSLCKQDKPQEEFPVDNTKKRGYAYKCLECQRSYAKKFNYPPTTEDIKCTVCHAVKPCDSFGINKRKPLGRNKICKRCHNLRLRERNVTKVY